MPAPYLTSRDSKRIPLREPHPLEIVAARTALRACPADAPYIAISLVGDLGACPERRSGLPHQIHAMRVADYLARSIDLDDLVAQSDRILAELAYPAGLTPSQAEVDEAGESSRATPGSSPACGSPAIGPETDRAGGR